MDDKVTAAPGEAEEIHALMRSQHFAETVKRLEAGYHLSTADGELWPFVVRHQATLQTYFAAFRSSVQVDRNYAYLVGATDLYGARRLVAAEMVVGVGLALLLFRPERLSTGGVTLAAFVEMLRTTLGSEDAYLAVFDRKRQRRASSRSLRSPEEKAGETLRKALGTLRRLGFCRIGSLGSGEMITPLPPASRFAAVVQAAVGGVHPDFDEAVMELIRQGRLHPGGAASPAEADEDSEDEEEQ